MDVVGTVRRTTVLQGTYWTWVLVLYVYMVVQWVSWEMMDVVIGTSTIGALEACRSPLGICRVLLSVS